MKPYRVVLLIEEEREVGRGLLRGIAQYSRNFGPWMFYREEPFYEKLSDAERLQRIKKWRPDGIIMREQGALDKSLLKLGVPVIYSGHRNGPAAGVPNILGDDREISQLAARYLLDKGFRHFGFCGFDDMWWSVDRGRFFAEALSLKGFQVSLYVPPLQDAPHSRDGEPELIAHWIKTLPKPCAVFACTDDRCRQVATACRLAGRRVPEEVALLGVDNDELTCEFAFPPLSSILLDTEKSGYDAAETLHRIMRGKKTGRPVISIPVSRVITRKSTDMIAVEDPVVVTALNYIREHYRKGVSVAEISRNAGVSRRVLEIRFRKAINRSVYEEVLLIRMNHACLLLLESSLSVAQISEALNYEEVKYFSRAFKQAIGVSPLAYRKQFSIRP
ncbi:MAG: DNA-binding transcriptional regulator [Kiritimatiellales bacterium]